MKSDRDIPDSTFPDMCGHSPLPVFSATKVAIPAFSNVELEAMMIEEELEKFAKIQTAHLADRWIKLCLSFELDGAAEWVGLMERYGAPDRAYHNLEHIADCLAQLDAHVELAKNRSALEFAIWFHDVIYDSKAHDNELKSAERAARFLGDTPICAKVVELIFATRHEATAGDRDQQLMADIDLSILGRSKEVYERYSQAIRSEYSWVPETDYVEGRARVLKGFYDRPSIFSLPDFQNRYEESARSNLMREFSRLGKWQLPKSGGGEDFNPSGSDDG